MPGNTPVMPSNTLVMPSKVEASAAWAGRSFRSLRSVRMTVAALKVTDLRSG